MIHYRLKYKRQHYQKCIHITPIYAYILFKSLMTHSISAATHQIYKIIYSTHPIIYHMFIAKYHYHQNYLLYDSIVIQIAYITFTSSVKNLCVCALFPLTLILNELIVFSINSPIKYLL